MAGALYATTLTVFVLVAVRPRLSVAVTTTDMLPDVLKVPVVTVVPEYVNPSHDTLTLLIVDPLDPLAEVTILSVDLVCTCTPN